MSEMVERVAKAMSVAGDAWVDATHGDWRDVDLNVLARAAIEAMREPTAPIVQMSFCSDFADRLWPAMIDEALK